MVNIRPYKTSNRCRNTPAKRCLQIIRTGERMERTSGAQKGHILGCSFKAWGLKLLVDSGVGFGPQGFPASLENSEHCARIGGADGPARSKQSHAKSALTLTPKSECKTHQSLHFNPDAKNILETFAQEDFHSQMCNQGTSQLPQPLKQEVR